MFVRNDLNRVIFAVELLLKNASINGQHSLTLNLLQSKVKVPQKYELVDKVSDNFITNIQNYGIERFSPQSKNNDFLTVNFNKANLFKNQIERKLSSFNCQVSEINNHTLKICW